MTKIIDLEIGAPKIGRAKEIGEAIRGRPGSPFPEALPRPLGYGFDNYDLIFGSGYADADTKPAVPLSEVLMEKILPCAVRNFPTASRSSPGSTQWMACVPCESWNAL